jgi:YjbE family integral membrane protein
MELLSYESIWAILAIILIDLVLAGDNALIIGMAAQRLPEHMRKKVIFWGTCGAIGIRFLSVAVITWLMQIPGLRLVGGLALLYIGWTLVGKQQHQMEAKATFWSAMTTIILADAVMGIDNALGIAAAANGDWTLIIMGLLISVPVVIFGSRIVVKILDLWPNVVYLGSFVLFAVGLQMIQADVYLKSVYDQISQIGLAWLWLTALGTALIQYAINQSLNQGVKKGS